MKQKNITPYEVYSPGDPFIVIAPGQIVDYPVRLTGCALILEEDNPESDVQDSDDSEKDEESDEKESAK